MHIKPKKSLGQNFLVDKNIQEKIIAACNLCGDDLVLEIGSGKGDLTARLSETAGEVYSIELDRRLMSGLERKLSRYPNCSILNYDILKFDIGKFFRDRVYKRKIKVVGNIPYYISTPIIEHLIEHRLYIEDVFMTVQKEFGRRVSAPPGSKEYGALSCFVRYYAEPGIVFEIKKGSFRPVPKVDSCFLNLHFRDRPPVRVADEGAFFRLIRTAFNQRRKTLRNSLAGLDAGKMLEDFFDKKGIDRNVRPERLSLEEFASLGNHLGVC